MHRVRTGLVRICGAVGNLSAGPWRKTRFLPDPERMVSDIACAANEIVLGHRRDGGCPAPPSTRTVLSGRIELPIGAGPVTGAAAVAKVERFLDQHGVNGLRSCRGEYCLAHLTRDGDTFYLYRALTASRWFYYRICGDKLTFSTDPEDLCDPHRPLYRQLDPDVLAALAIQTPIPGDGSWYEGVRRLPAGHLFTVGPQGLRTQRHHDLRVADATRVPFDAAAATFRELCSGAVARATEDVSSIGIQLSGGLDSAVVAVEAHHHGHGTAHPFYFHYDLPGMAEERAMADAVARQCGLRLNTIDGTASLDPGGAYLLSGQPLRAPLTHGFVLPNLAACHALATQPGPRRLLSGVGGDELQMSDSLTPARTFGWGALNPLRAGGPLWQLFDNDMIRQLLGRSLDESAPHGWPSRVLRVARILLGTAPVRTTTLEPIAFADGIPWFTPEAMHAARAVGKSAIRDFAEGFDAARRDVKRIWQEMFTTYMTFHLDVNDYYMSAWQYAVFDDKDVEYVAPLLDRDLVEFCLTLNTRYRQPVHRGHTVSKALMRAGYTGRLPRALLARLDKVDYSPINQTLVINNKHLFRELLGPDARLAELGILTPHLVRNLLEQPTWQLRRSASELLHTASLELWLRGCDRRPHQPIRVVELPRTSDRTPPQPRINRAPENSENPPAHSGNGTWRLAPHALVRFLADEAVLLNEEQFKVYRLNAGSADLLNLALRCGTWPRLAAELRHGDPTSTSARLGTAQKFITSLCQAGLLTGSPPEGGQTVDIHTQRGKRDAD